MAAISKPRLAIIGCGAVVDHHLMPALRRIGWVPTVLADPSVQRQEVVARRLGSAGKSATRVANWEAALDKFDAAVVAVPHVLHGPIGIALLKAGKYVFMEKPLASKASECREMVALAQAKGLALSVGLLRRYLHIARWTKALIDSGVLGKIQRFEAREGFVFNWATSTDALLKPEMACGGVLMDTGAHTLDLLVHWLGDAKKVDYYDDAEGGVEADCIVDLQMESGATGRIELSRTRDLRNTVKIEGSQGFVEAHLYKNEVLAGSPQALSFKHNGMAAADLPLQLFPELFDAELRDFLARAAGDSSVGFPGSEGQRSVELIERCYSVRQPLIYPWAETPARSAGPRPSFPRGATVVVTGATGFIGGRLVERLVRDYGARVRCIVREVGHATRLARLPVEIIKADLADATAIDKAVKSSDYVFHCAYDVRSRDQNIIAMRNFIASCSAHAVKRFVHVSTFSVYEPFPDGPLSEETRDGDLSWIYAKTKLDLEKDVLDAVKQKSLAATIVQPSIVYGPFSKPWTNAPAENLIFGDVILPDQGQGLCNAVYIDDLIDGMLLTAIKQEAVGERFILSGPRPVTWTAFFGEIAKSLSTKPPVYWPAEKISKENHGIMRDVKLVVKNPKRIMQIIVRWYPARQALQQGLDAMPKAIKDLVNKHYFGSGGRKPGEIILPDPQGLALYASKAEANCEKARRLLGYDPEFDFEKGMTATRPYLQWAYNDLRRTVQSTNPGADDTGQIAIGAKQAHAG